MSYHIVCQIGEKDAHLPRVRKGDVIHCVSLGRPADAEVMRIRNTVLECLREAHLDPPVDAVDLLNFAMAVYATDLGIPRGTAYDSWSRDLILHFPVTHPDLWEPLIPTLQQMLGFLSGDHWRLHIRRRVRFTAPTPTLVVPEPPSAVSLFSGGLDSFVGAVERLEHGETLALVGHHGAGSANSAQTRAYSVIAKAYDGKSLLLPFYVQPPAGPPGPNKKTTRARSILFLALGTVVAAAAGKKVPLLVPENGLISINAPLVDARLGSLSTRTTHPHFINLYGQIVDGLGLTVSVQTPYSFQTKGEMLAGVLDNDAFKSGFAQTISCSHPEVGRYQGQSPGQHCGYCVPCIIRRAALAHVGLDDPKHYLRDILKKKNRTGTTEGRDLLAFRTAIERLHGATRRQLRAEVLNSGPIPQTEVSQYVDVFDRGMAEVAKLLSPARAKV